MKKIIKKVFSVLLCLSMISSVYILIKPVFADDVNVIIASVTQDGELLEKEGDVYIAPELSSITVGISLDPNPATYTKIIAITNGTYTHTDYNKSLITEISPHISYEQEINEYTAKVCSDWNCDTVYGETTFKVKFTRYAELANGKVYLTEASQGGEIVEPNDGNGFVFNDVQDITLKFKGENLIDDFTYLIYDYTNETEYTGSELMAGITYVYKPEEYGYFGLYYSVAGSSKEIDYKKNGEVIDVWYTLTHSDSIPSFTPSLFYTDYPSISFEHMDLGWNNKFDAIANKYHNANHTLSVRIEGNNFENKDYPFALSVYGDDEEIFTLPVNINGNLLNSGHNIELTGLNLANFNANNYRFKISAVGAEKVVEYKYESRTLTLTSLKQKGVDLSQVDGVYQALGFSEYYATFDISDYNSVTDDFTLRVSSTSGGWGTGYEPGEEFTFDPDLNNKQATYDLYLCDEYDCNVLYAHTTITINSVNYEAYKNGKLYISNVTQGGETADFDTENWEFSFNDKQDIRFRVYGTNLIDDATYGLNINYNSYATVTGSELENGIDVVYNTNSAGDDLTVTFTFEGNYVNSYCYNSGTEEYCNGTNYHYISYAFNKTVVIPTYEGSLIYTNYKNTPINLVSVYSMLYQINSNYHNQNNSLSYRITGSDFENKNYQVALKVTKNEEEYFTHTYTVNGSALNDGYDLKLEGLTLALRTDYTYSNEYNFEFTICDVSTSYNTLYGSSDGTPYVGGSFYRDKNKHSLITGAIWIDVGGMVVPLNGHYFDNDTTLGATYSGYDFENNTNYDYKLEYGYIAGEGDDAHLVIARTLSSGKVMGSVLNNNGIDFMLDNDNNYNRAVYRFTVKKGVEIIAYDIVTIELTDAPSLVETTVTASGQVLPFLDTEEDTGFVTPRNRQVTFTVRGVGFENKDYIFRFCSTKIRNNGMNYGDWDDPVCENQTLRGSEINNGTAKFIFNKESDATTTHYNIDIKGSNFNLANEAYAMLKMVDADAIIISTAEYVNVNDDLLRNIAPGTAYSTFMDKITLGANYTKRLYDKTGNTIVTNKVGTGMILKIFGTDDVAMQLLLVVKGDVNGDGNLTLTDLVKVKSHLLENEMLEGVYESAGNVDGTAGISVTDLVQMSKAVTGIKELD